jgi:hypothetical protein
VGLPGDFNKALAKYDMVFCVHVEGDAVVNVSVIGPESGSWFETMKEAGADLRLVVEKPRPEPGWVSNGKGWFHKEQEDGDEG